MNTTKKTFLGRFGKGIENSRSLNYNESGSIDCPRTCRHHPRSTSTTATFACYAVRMEKLYTNVKTSLRKRAELKPWQITNAPLAELMNLDKPIAWLRFCVSGSMPRKSLRVPLFVESLRRLLRHCQDVGTLVHMPVASRMDAREYREIVDGLCVVRESLQSTRRWKTELNPVSIVAGGKTTRERVENARELARQRREATGRKTIVCPAVTAGWATRYRGMPANDKAKCGSCTACAQPLVDIVYPQH